MHLAVVDPLEPGVQAGAELHHRRRGVGGQELADPEVNDRGPQDCDEPARAATVLGGVVVYRPNHLGGLGIAEHRVFLLGLTGAGGQRDEQGLLHGSQARLVLVVHLLHYTRRPAYVGYPCAAGEISRSASP